MSDLSEIPTGSLLDELTGRLTAAEAELAGLREQRDLVNGLIKAKAPEVDRLRRMVAAQTPRTRKPKPQAPEAETPPAPPVSAQTATEDPVQQPIAPAFQPE